MFYTLMRFQSLDQGLIDSVTTDRVWRMIRYFEKRLSAKILVVLIVILVVSFAALGFSVLSKQESLLAGMRENVRTKLKLTGEDANVLFNTIASTVGDQLSSMGQETAANLSAVTG